MSIKRYFASKDNSITNAFLSNLVDRATGSNVGVADSVEVFSIFAQANSSSNEQMKTLIQFDVLNSENSATSIQADRAAGRIPASGSVNFFLKLFDTIHQSRRTLLVLRISPIRIQGKTLRYHYRERLL